MSKVETPRPIRGTQDIFGAEAEAFAHVVETFERVRKLYRFRRIEMPVFERTEVFARSIGETTDIVSKEMYSFEDRGGESLTLRPEFTAGIARAYLTDGWQQYAPLKVATHGPLFRYERPQKGRYRQFHQIDAEIIGAAEPQADVELLAMADQVLRELGIADVTLQLNTLGDADSREAWRAALLGHFRAVKGELERGFAGAAGEEPAAHPRQQGPARPGVRRRCAEDRRVPVATRPGVLRRRDRPGSTRRACADARNEGLVRGLDYYRHTAFEFVPDEGSASADKLGSQSTVLGGGRYDGLMECARRRADACRGLGCGDRAAGDAGWGAGSRRLSRALAIVSRALSASAGSLCARVRRFAGASCRQVSAPMFCELFDNWIVRVKRFDRGRSRNGRRPSASCS